MAPVHSDALVFFGATGDLAYKMIFPALQSMVKRGHLDVPVIGVAKAGWNLDQLKGRARDSVTKHGGIDEAAFTKLASLLRYVDGDYSDPATFQNLHKMLGGAQHPAHYLAIPPPLFGTVVEQLGKSNCASGARVIVEKPFGVDLQSAVNLNNILHSVFSESAIFRIDHYLGKRPVQNMVFFRFANIFTEAFWNRKYVSSIEITMAEDFGVEGRGGFYDATGAVRDVIQNHLFQVLSNLCMEPPARTDGESLRDEKVKVLKAIPPMDQSDIARGQFDGYLKEKGVAPGSQTETFAAVRLEIDSWRWSGVPVFIRAGKCLPLTAAEVYVRLRRPPPIFHIEDSEPNHVRFRISPDVTIALGATVLAPGEEPRSPSGRAAGNTSAPSRRHGSVRSSLLGDAMVGDSSEFARQDYVEEAWRIVDPILKSNVPVAPYMTGTWGPELERHLIPPGGWHDPTGTA